jgi:hypothetical protein
MPEDREALVSSDLVCYLTCACHLLDPKQQTIYRTAGNPATFGCSSQNVRRSRHGQCHLKRL